MVTTFREEHLLHPEARRRTVEQAEQGKMVCLGGIAGEYNEGGRIFECLGAAIKYEVVMCGDEGKGDREGSAESMCQKPIPLPPSTAKFSVIPAEFATTP
jgi:hypothetical protein